MKLKIGAFSHATKISKRMLRYYDEKELLQPVVDSNGYRLYQESDIRRAEQIKRLRDLSFNVEEIKAFLHGTAPERQNMYEHKLHELEKSTDAYNEAIDYIRRILSQTQAIAPLNTYDVMEGDIAGYTACVSRARVKSSELDQYFMKLDTQLTQMNIEAIGRPFARIFDIAEDHSWDIEAGTAVQSNDSAALQRFPACKVLQTIHYGSYDQLGNAYGALYRYAQYKCMHLKEPFTEIYLTDSSIVADPANFVTLLQAEITA